MASPKPKNKALYSRVKAEAKRKFKVYPIRGVCASGSRRTGVMLRQERSVGVVEVKTKTDHTLLVDLKR